MIRAESLLIVTCLVLLGATRAQRLLLDVEPARDPSTVSGLTGSTSGLAWFSGWTPEHGSEVWRSDGTTAGTYMLADFTPGPQGSLPSGFTDAAGTMWFSMSGGLFTSDGTLAGTRRIHDVAARHITRVGDEAWFVDTGGTWRSDGTRDGTTRVHAQANGLFVKFGAGVYFSATDQSGRVGLWRSDGTPTGTTLVAAFPNLVDITASDRFLFLRTGGTNEQLWRSDGTAAGTALVRYFLPTIDGALRGLAAVGDRVCFNYPDPSSGNEPWVSDGFVASLLRDIRPGSAGSVATGAFVAAYGAAWFVADEGAGNRLWRTDGTSAGTTRFSHVAAVHSFAMQVVGARVFFQGDDGSGVEPWVSDGTPGGEFRLGDLAPGPASSLPGPFTLAGNTVFFVANTNEVWRSDGTPAGTALVRRFDRGFGSGVDGATRIGRRLLFHARTTTGNALWSSDGTAPGTTRLVNFQTLPFLLLGAAAGDVHVFAADASAEREEPWRSDGTAAGSFLLHDVNPNGPSDPRLFVSVGDKVVFVARDGPQRFAIWCTDGTRGGTRFVRDIADIGAERYSATTLGGHAYFAVNGLWKTDGTAAGTSQLSTLSVVDVGAAGGLVYFDGDNALYRTDGTSGGTIRVARRSRSPRQFTDVGGSLYFTATDATSGHELWTSDGTADGTVLVADLLPGFLSSNPSHLRAVDGRLYFIADDAVHGYEPWTSDGTTNGTMMLRDIRPGAEGSIDPTRAPLRIGDHRVVFAADDGVHGRELWVTDGTPAGTRLAADVVPGSLPSNPDGFATVASADGGALLFFVADHLIAGPEPHVLDLASLDASVTEGYGTGCAAAPREVPSLSDDGRPSLGRTDFALVGRASANRPCAVLVSLSPDSIALPGGCTLLVGGGLVGGGVFVDATTDASGVARVPIPVPDQASLLGLRVFSQLVVVVPGGAFGGVIDLSHGHVALVGRD